MTHKFIIAEPIPETNESLPVLYKLHIGNKYYIHKGRKLKESANRLLYDVFRATKNAAKVDSKPLVISEYYSNLVDYCVKFPQVHKVMIELVLNDTPEKVLAMEAKLLKKASKDIECINRTDLAQYKPEWMLRDKYQKRCESCIESGVIGGKDMKFMFCPQCGKAVNAK